MVTTFSMRQSYLTVAVPKFTYGSDLCFKPIFRDDSIREQRGSIGTAKTRTPIYCPLPFPSRRHAIELRYASPLYPNATSPTTSPTRCQAPSLKVPTRAPWLERRRSARNVSVCKKLRASSPHCKGNQASTRPSSHVSLLAMAGKYAKWMNVTSELHAVRLSVRRRVRARSVVRGLV